MKALRELMPPDPKRSGEKARPRRELAEVRKAVEMLKAKFFSAPRGKRNRVELIVAHGNLIRYLVRLAMGDRATDWWRLGTNNCGMTLIAIRHGTPNCMFHYNDVGHLPKSMQSMM
jgi:broad specificity phosphatase PhoE